ncbi:ABC transporter permease [Helicobacter felis]|uniref:Dipeptide transport system permease protein n=1 Tax=Helicobacter felis (strain ATCC 49179 / CCUG 28539 / NCTC 12436 / CS1) TaxID=936155 RepID=E7AA66_HELFC|nr:ABC transporter permease [Helicobacter felis]CBY82638.1 dipeptide transport system permease protein [Helicobacter felis ATCC 49179]
MLSFILKRILWTIPTLFGVTIIVFAMVHLVPGDPALMILGEHASKESVEALREQMGLNKPLLEQYFLYINHIFHGDFGKSFMSGEPVIEEFLQRFPATIELSLSALIISIILGLFVGILAAIKRYSFFDYTSMSLALAGVSMPVFWLGLMLIYFFGVKLGWFPTYGRLSDQFYLDGPTGFYLIDSLLAHDYEAFVDALKHLILPATALATIPTAIIARMTRASMLEVAKEDYVRTAKAKGCSPFRVIAIHTLRNALIPVTTVVGLMLAGLLGGSILTETTFSWPGVGKWMVNALNQRDFPIIQTSSLIVAVIFITANLLVDILYAFINPRIRLS